MGTQHTRGPWVIIPHREYDGDDETLLGSYESFAGIEGADGNPVCEFGTNEGSGTIFENTADYALIAAAPDLLESAVPALHELDVVIDLIMNEQTRAEMQAVADKLRAAIAKALGQ